MSKSPTSTTPKAVEKATKNKEGVYRITDMVRATIDVETSDQLI